MTSSLMLLLMVVLVSVNAELVNPEELGEEEIKSLGPHHYAVPAPYAHTFSNGYPEGFGVQTGYEGYLIPAPAAGGGGLFGKKGLITALPSFLLFMKLFGKFGGILVNLAWHLLIGGALTLGVCTLTPICTLTFLGFGLRREKVREQIRTFVTPTVLDEISRFVRTAIEKYDQMQRQWDKDEEKASKKRKNVTTIPEQHVTPLSNNETKK